MFNVLFSVWFFIYFGNVVLVMKVVYVICKLIIVFMGYFSYYWRMLLFIYLGYYVFGWNIKNIIFLCEIIEYGDGK